MISKRTKMITAAIGTFFFADFRAWPARKHHRRFCRFQGLASILGDCFDRNGNGTL